MSNGERARIRTFAICKERKVRRGKRIGLNTEFKIEEVPGTSNVAEDLATRVVCRRFPVPGLSARDRHRNFRVEKKEPRAFGARECPARKEWRRGHKLVDQFAVDRKKP